MNKVLQDFVGRYKEKVDLGIARELEWRLEEVKDISPYLTPIVTAMKELSVGGKRLRGLLTILGYELANPSGPGPEGWEIIKAAIVLQRKQDGLPTDYRRTHNGLP